jgi:hypothetical protein
MKKTVLTLALAFFAITFSNNVFAQCDSIANMCVKHMTAQYISDGQQYRALLLDQETAEFNATFYGNTTYRVAACSGKSDGNLVFTVFDKDKNVLFTNKDYQNAPYWDFKVNNTLECTIEAHLNSTLSSGCAVLLISFKQ